MRRGKGEQVMEHSSFPLEFQSPDGKTILRTAQRYYQLFNNVVSATIYIMSEIPF